MLKINFWWIICMEVSQSLSNEVTWMWNWISSKVDTLRWHTHSGINRIGATVFVEADSYFSASQLSKRFEDLSQQRISRQFFKVPISKKGMTRGKWDVSRQNREKQEPKLWLKVQMYFHLNTTHVTCLWFSVLLFWWEYSIHCWWKYYTFRREYIYKLIPPPAHVLFDFNML